MKPGAGEITFAGPAEFAPMTGTDAATYTREGPGMSAFALEDDVVYHTYSTYERGLDIRSSASTLGSTERPKDAMKPVRGFAVTMSTTRAEHSSRMGVER